MNKKNIGQKALRLNDLKQLNLKVPDFCMVDSYKVSLCFNEDGSVKDFAVSNLVEDILKDLNCDLYAVRSSALVEDSNNESYAGQFKTVLGVSSSELVNAIKDVLEYAFDYLDGNIEKFSFFVQEFIEPDYAGVVFTRNPEIGREMVIEYVKGRGEDLVGGKKIAKKIIHYKDDKFERLDFLKNRLDDFWKIEQLYNFPQDIEWCVKDDEFYFLQTRPITTIGENNYKEYLFLDEFLKESGDYYYAKTGISEIVPRPSTFALDLLQKIYNKNGPIDKVYKKFNIKYFKRDFLKIIGNELFVDKEEELKTLLPAQSFLSTEKIKQSFVTFSGFWTTIKNISNLNKIKIDNQNEFQEKLANLDYDFKKTTVDLSQLLDDFLRSYKYIFEINLKAEISLNKFKSEVDKEKISSLMNFGQSKFSKNLWQVKIGGREIVGNSLNIMDESKFIKSVVVDNDEVAREENISKNILIDLENLIVWNNLREQGRVLVVRKMNRIRKELFVLALRNNFSNKRDIYFSTWDEIFNSLKEEKCKERKNNFEQYNKYNFPIILTNKKTGKNKKSFSVSAGFAEGILVTASDLDSGKYKNEKKILYTKILSPDLVKYFDDIEGIISESGSMLSHLAIIARERKLPVLVKEKNKNKLGEFVKFDNL